MATKNKPLKKKKPAVKRCGDCSGAGLIPDNRDAYKVRECQTCNGKGVLPVYQGAPESKSSANNGVA